LPVAQNTPWMGLMKKELPLLFSVLLVSGCNAAVSSSPTRSQTPPGAEPKTYRNFNDLPPIVMPPFNNVAPPAVGHMPAP
jgi:hypothetical protein